jgi:hypothetical protein
VAVLAPYFFFSATRLTYDSLLEEEEPELLSPDEEPLELLESDELIGRGVFGINNNY